MNKGAEEYYAARGISFKKHHTNDASYVSSSDSGNEQSTPEPKSTNTVASILKIFAFIIYISGFCIGIALFILLESISSGSSSAITFLPALCVWLMSFVQGTMMYGFAEIVRLLQVIADK